MKAGLITLALAALLAVTSYITYLPDESEQRHSALAREYQAKADAAFAKSTLAANQIRSAPLDAEVSSQQFDHEKWVFEQNATLAAMWRRMADMSFTTRYNQSRPPLYLSIALTVTGLILIILHFRKASGNKHPSV